MEYCRENFRRDGATAECVSSQTLQYCLFYGWNWMQMLSWWSTTREWVEQLWNTLTFQCHYRRNIWCYFTSQPREHNRFFPEQDLICSHAFLSPLYKSARSLLKLNLLRRGFTFIYTHKCTRRRCTGAEIQPATCLRVWCFVSRSNQGWNLFIRRLHLKRMLPTIL